MIAVGGIDGPFLGTEAVGAGLVSRRQLRNRYRAVYRNVYVPIGTELTATTRATAAWLWSGRQATLCGLSASALHSSRWIDARLPAELIRKTDDVEGIVIHRDKLVDDEVCLIGGMSTTTAVRTAYDLGRRDSLTRAVMRLDALSNATGLRRHAVDPLVDRHRGARGIVQLRKALDLMDGGAESPQETRTRLLLIAAGFPRPQTQILVVDEYGYLIGRIDMGWEDFSGGWTPERATLGRVCAVHALGGVNVSVQHVLCKWRCWRGAIGALC